MQPTPTFDDIVAALAVGRGLVLETPLLPSTSFTRLTGRNVLLKAENLQRTGSFKIRGALNALSQLDAEQRARGVVAASAGNHAQGVALAAAHLGIPATVIMPENAAIPKIEATRSYGAEVRLAGSHLGESIDVALTFATETGARFVHPYDDPAIIAGQGTLGLELLEQLPDLGSVVIPVGGGGLIAGTALAIANRRPEVRVVGVQSEAVPTYVVSRRAGAPTAVEPKPTVADGIACVRPSPIAFDLIERHVAELVTVDDAAAMEAVALLLERAKLLVEPSGAVGVAALLHDLVADLPEPVVVVLSGGNIDLLVLEDLVRHGLEARGRFGALAVRVPDVPGQLARVLSIIGDRGGNVLTVEHRREGARLPFGVVEIHLTIETRSADHLDEITTALQAAGIELT